jgi:catechol 2,3-dioxygenase-like lactoylglutathione lyase family enzyme
MNLKQIGTITALCLAIAASPSRAQLLAAKDAPVAYGHHHLNVTDISTSLKFFADTLGGTPLTVAGRQMVKFPNVLVILRQQPPTGGSKGSSVDHLGFSVPNLRTALDKLKANGYRIVTNEEAPAPWVVTDDIGRQAGRDIAIAFTMGPDDVKVELVEIKNQQAPVSLHHVHFASPHAEHGDAGVVRQGVRRQGRCSGRGLPIGDAAGRLAQLQSGARRRRGDAGPRGGSRGL